MNHTCYYCGKEITISHKTEDWYWKRDKTRSGFQIFMHKECYDLSKMTLIFDNDFIKIIKQEIGDRSFYENFKDYRWNNGEYRFGLKLEWEWLKND